MELLTYTYLKARSLYIKAKDSIFDVESVQVYNDDTITDFTFRFYFLRSVINLKKYIGKHPYGSKYLSSYFDKLANYFEIDNCKIHLSKKHVTGKKDIIVDLQNSNIHDLIKELDLRTKIERKMDPKILTLCKLDENCIKKITKNYKEDNLINDHTLENILLFNNIKYDNNSVIKIEYFEKGKKITLEYYVKDVKNLHINLIINNSM